METESRLDLHAHKRNFTFSSRSSKSYWGGPVNKIRHSKHECLEKLPPDIGVPSDHTGRCTQGSTEDMSIPTSLRPILFFLYSKGTLNLEVSRRIYCWRGRWHLNVVYRCWLVWLRITALRALFRWTDHSHLFVLLS